MRLSTPLALIVVALTVAPAVADDLFSEFAVESVFAKSTSAKTATASSATPRITGAGQLGEMLRAADLTPQRIDGKSVKTTVSLGEWTLPTTLRAAVSRGQIDLTMGLATPTKASDIASDKLLRLLTVSPDAGGAHFALDGESGQIQLRQSISARDLTSDRLGRMLREMAELAASRQSAWYEAGSKKAAAAVKTVQATPLTGSWIASLGGGEAFAIKLTAEGRFKLAHVKSGRTTTSDGKAQRTGEQLSLVGSTGVTIKGTVSAQTAKGFDLTLTGGRKLSFKKAS